MAKKTSPGVIGSLFLTGLMVLLPLYGSFLVLNEVLKLLDSILGPVFTKYLGFSIPGLGLIALIIIIWITGILTANFVGKKIVNFYESAIARVPVLNTLFSAIKSISLSLFSSSKKTFTKVVLVDLPNTGIQLVGFLTSDQETAIKDKFSKKTIFHIFVPHAPNPTTGFLLLAEPKNIHPVDVSVEDGFKMVVSMGTFHPQSYTLTGPLGKKQK